LDALSSTTSEPAFKGYTEAELAAMSAKDRRAAKRKMDALNLKPLEEPKEEPNAAPKKAKAKKGKAASTSDLTTALVAAPAPAPPLYTEAELEAMPSKERRSAKRKMEALAAEAAAVDVTEYRSAAKKEAEEAAAAAELEAAALAARGGRAEDKGDDKKKVNPYIVFVGQLDFKTTKDALLKHMRATLENPKIVDDCTVRLLTDEKTKRSRGMGFIQTSTPENMYELLKLHKTTVEGRRINVERTTGGGKNNDKRKDKLKGFREEQSKLMSETIAKILKEFQDRGEIEEGELDEGVIGLCGRHTAATVQQSLKEYVDMRGGDKLTNPSAYLTAIITRVSVDGVEASEKDRANARENDKNKKKNGGGGGAKRSRGGNGDHGDGKRPRNDKPVQQRSQDRPPMRAAAMPAEAPTRAAPIDTGGIKLTMPAPGAVLSKGRRR
jgi:RNA recognition motif-containing protein